MLLEYRHHGLQIELGSQIHDRAVFLVEGLLGLSTLAVALDEVAEDIVVGVHMAL